MSNSPNQSFNKTTSNFTSIHSNSLTRNQIPIYNQTINMYNIQNNGINTPNPIQNHTVNVSLLNNTFNSKTSK
jgi:hypothetical protein